MNNFLETIQKYIGKIQESPEDLNVDYNGEQAEFADIAEIVANSYKWLKQMGKDGLTVDDLENNSKKFYKFIITHLEELKTEFNFSANPQDLEVDYYYELKNSPNIEK